jgi:maltose alpha-D-glucosyltransferase/alpha-amylase
MHYFGDAGERLQMLFQLRGQSNAILCVGSRRRPLIAALDATKPRPANAQWGMFLRNHGPDPDMQL